VRETVTVEVLKTCGISPKVFGPFLGLLVTAVVLLLAGEHELGVALLLASAGQFGIGFALPAGKVKAAVRRG
jgi:hypothetical protein